MLSLSKSVSNKVQTFTDEARYKNSVICPHCHSKEVVKNVTRKGIQRYICHSCKKSFTSTTKTVFAYIKKDFSTIQKYIECMLNKFSIRKTAEICSIHRDTAFLWRHKILDALQNMADSVTLSGVIEADETFFNISYKGMKRDLPRKARKMPKKQ